MSDDRSTFEVTRARLEDIVTHVRRKDVSLEQSLDLLEEAVRLVNQCNDLIDQTSFKPAAPEAEAAPEAPSEAAAEPEAVAESEDAQSGEPVEATEGETGGEEPEVVDTFVELGEIEFVIEDDERE